MWANAQRNGRPAEHRWRSLFNAATDINNYTVSQNREPLYSRRQLHHCRPIFNILSLAGSLVNFQQNRY